MIKKEEVVSYYDNYVPHNWKIAYNERHLLMIEKLKACGLREESRVLELGAGIGVITSLILKEVKKGTVVSTDLSPKRIGFAQNRLSEKYPNAQFRVEDISDFTIEGQSFDFITLFDVLEHVPQELHKKAFKEIYKHLHDQSIVVINIPHPACIDYLHENQPDSLQVIDQALSADNLIADAYDAGLVLEFFESYSIWQHHDYQFMVFRKKYAFNPKRLKNRKGFLDRIKNKLG